MKVTRRGLLAGLAALPMAPAIYTTPAIAMGVDVGAGDYGALHVIADGPPTLTLPTTGHVDIYAKKPVRVRTASGQWVEDLPAGHSGYYLMEQSCLTAPRN